jgi:prepilin-type N-terminal cleavage/methylation domain-containing protein
MYKLFHLKNGFSLLELIVVMSVMSIMVSIGVYSFQRSLVNSRDQRRKADLVMVQGALDNYKSNSVNSSYPQADYAGLESLLVPNYLSVFPNDPHFVVGSDTGNYVYLPSCDADGVCKTYLLSATLESSQQSYTINQNGEVTSTSPGQCLAVDKECAVNEDCCSNKCDKLCIK